MPTFWGDLILKASLSDQTNWQSKKLQASPDELQQKCQSYRNESSINQPQVVPRQLVTVTRMFRDAMKLAHADRLQQYRERADRNDQQANAQNQQRINPSFHAQTNPCPSLKCSVGRAKPKR